MTSGRTTPRSRGRAFASAMLALLVVSVSLVASPTPASADDPTAKLLLMLDASGSMNGKDPSGSTKIKAAQKALTSVVNTLPADSQVGLRVYGATVQGGRPTPQACADTQLVHPIGPLDRPGLTKAINGFKAKGETPIAGSLKAAMGDLGTEGKRNIVLVSDGEESCVPDPCPVVKKLVDAGIDLRIDTVGFAVNAKARKQLECIARVGHGSYYDAKDADQLESSLTALSTRAVRPFVVRGTPIIGTPTTDNAPAMTPGLWTDSLTAGDGDYGSAKKFYVVKRTIPNSTLHISVSARPTSESGEVSIQSELIRFADAEPTGRTCLGLSGMAQPMDNSSVMSDSIDFPGTKSQGEWCTADAVPIWISRDRGGKTPLPIEILVMEEPPLTAGGETALPSPPMRRVPDATPSPMQGAQPAVGGGSFTDAPLITPGTWTEQYVPSETILYRVHLDWGQSLQLTVQNPRLSDAWRISTHYTAWIYGPDRAWAAIGNLGYTKGNSLAPLTRLTAPVTYANRDESMPTVSHTQLAGDYYIAISMPGTYGDNKGAGVPFPVTFRVDVTGTPQAPPPYATAVAATGTATPSPTATDSPSAAASVASAPVDAGPSPLPWILGGIGLAAVVIGGAAFVVSRQGRRRTDQH